MSHVKKLHKLNMERKTLNGMVLVEAHDWARDLQDYNHTPSGLDIACLECDLWACSKVGFIGEDWKSAFP
jgi:hypothetical protein